jgi:hypothetical protein
MKTFSEFNDIEEMAKHGYVTILLDENLRGLETALEDDGFKVVMPLPGLKDEELRRKARGWVILTQNSKDFVDDAPRFDYDVIGVEDIKFIDNDPTRKNQTVRKISNAVRRSQLGSRRGTFLLTIKDDGSYHLRELL